MEDNKNPAARRLLEAFTQFHRLKWRQSPVAGLKPSEIWVLFKIKKLVKPESPGVKVSDISSSLQVAAPTITQLINGLEAGGFVERTMDKEDRRAVRVSLTANGKDVIETAGNTLFNTLNGLVEYLGGEEKSDELAELLSKVFTYFEKLKKETDQ